MKLAEIICPKCGTDYHIEGKIFNSSVHCTECQFVFATPEHIIQRWSLRRSSKTTNIIKKLWVFSLLLIVFLNVMKEKIIHHVPLLGKYFIYYGNNTDRLKNYIIINYNKQKKQYSIYNSYNHPLIIDNFYITNNNSSHQLFEGSLLLDGSAKTFPSEYYGGDYKFALDFPPSPQ